MSERDVDEPEQVVPILRDLGTAAGHGLVVLSLEVWSAFADLRFARVDRGAERPLARRVPPPQAWRVDDDRGSAYAVLDAVGRGDRQRTTGEIRIAPPPPAGATTLTVTVTLAPGTTPLSGSFDLTGR